MSNPFIMPGSPIAELERKRRERFRVGVYVVLGASTAFLAGMLIQGCQRQQKVEDATVGYPVALSTNPVSASSESQNKPDTNSAVAAAVTPEQAPASALPLTNAVMPPPSRATNESAPVTSPATVMPATASEAVYTVKRGDTLTRIAKAHGTTVKAIKAANGLKTDRILVGQELKLPQGNATAVSAAQS